MPLSRHIRPIPRFRDDAVQARALELLEPILCRLRIARVRREEDGLLDALEKLLESRAPHAERYLAKVIVAFGQDVECDEPGGCGLAQHPDPGFWRMGPLLAGGAIQASGSHH